MYSNENENTICFKTDGFHIDYVFASKAILSVLSDVSLGSYADWVKPKISDHVPLTVSLALP